jgi:hypothetical protein
MSPKTGAFVKGVAIGYVSSWVVTLVLGVGLLAYAYNFFNNQNNQ